MAACGLESVHFKTTFSEQLAVADLKSFSTDFTYSENIYLVTLLHWSSHSGIFSVEDASNVPLDTGHKLNDEVKSRPVSMGILNFSS